MAGFVLVHGAWHGGWCWQKLVRSLRDAGHETLAPDLPGHGDDATPHERIELQSYCDRVCEAVDSLEGEVVLVGHSLGGLTISQVAEHRADRLRALVYLAAFIPEAEGVTRTTDAVTDRLRSATSVSEDGHSICFDPDLVREVFYADCSEDDLAFARARLGPEPQRVFGSPLALSDDGFGRVPRDYIVCLQDEAVRPEAQLEMARRHGCRNVYSMDRSHSPFFSAPGELAKILGEIADG
jgi:pimeloyl-ACP methyl ester carboxylesterase